ncbi:sensor histidine kinase [Ferviditalea candida]|uniref:histidine kinase n=1 Tax=Ferviditalea candida TaxID=3108399 RepID=A0ABU5ZHW9_9BACL|nr:ATP-binding protein [Paenibacillaceae bacterium T2]
MQFSKPHISKLRIESLQVCLDKAKSIIQTEIERRGHSFHMEEKAGPLFVEMDPDKIVQVLVNLFKNAIEAMHEVGEIHISTYDIKDHAAIEVSDNGPGIPESIMDKLFNPFFTTKPSGTGLGLAISQKIVQDHGGRIGGSINEAGLSNFAFRTVSLRGYSKPLSGDSFVHYQ